MWIRNNACKKKIFIAKLKTFNYFQISKSGKFKFNYLN